MSPTESAWPAVIVSALIAVILITRWIATQQKGFLWGALAALVLGAGAILLDAYVETDEERVTANLVALADAVRDGELETALSFLSQTPQARECHAIVRAGMAVADIEDDLRITDIRLQKISAGSQITSHFRANATIRAKGVQLISSGRGPTRWLLTWHREAGDWKVISIERLKPMSGEPMQPLAPRLE